VLARGSHALRLLAHAGRGGHRTTLLWSDPVRPEEPIAGPNLFSPLVRANGLLGSYYLGGACEGEPAFRQIDPLITFYFDPEPLPRPFAACWTGSVWIDAAGAYRFGTQSIDASSVFLDGARVVENGGEGGYQEGVVQLDRGWHGIDVHFETRNRYSRVVLSWVPPGKTREPVPSTHLRPPGPSGARIARGAPWP
jgi:hypothetical protein